jgi:circadian clock protein KaiC
MGNLATNPPPLARVSSGVPGLDTILNGGFLQGGIYLIMGAPGTGKTILSNQICSHHVAGGERALYVTLLAESHARMLAHLRTLSFFDSSVVADGLCWLSGEADTWPASCCHTH